MSYLLDIGKSVYVDLISEKFIIHKEEKAFKPIKNKQFGMYHENKWYSLDFKINLVD